MKKYPMFRCRFRAPWSIIYLLVFCSPLLISPLASAMPHSYDQLSRNDDNIVLSDPEQHKQERRGVIRRHLLNVGIRARLSSTDVLGDTAPEEFREYDVFANFRLPWSWYSQAGWGVGTRLMTSAGALNAAGQTALVMSIIPLIALGSEDGRFTVDMGAGGALMTRRRFGMQDYGGYFQFALTVGVGVPLFKGLGGGYRFLHYSDAAIYGPHNTGADFHMLEFICRF